MINEIIGGAIGGVSIYFTEASHIYTVLHMRQWLVQTEVCVSVSEAYEM